MNNTSTFFNISKPVLLLTGFALFGVITLGILYDLTRDKIAFNEQEALIKQLNHVFPTDRFDNDLLKNTVELPAKAFHTTMPVKAYLATQKGKPAGVIFATNTPDGYSGTIKMVVGIDMRRTVTGVRVIAHKETPGLGDKIDITKSDWILSFNDKSLNNPDIEQWKVKKDGGTFDQFTGATITPRAIVNGVRTTLLWANEPNKLSTLFNNPIPSHPHTSSSEQ